MITNSINLKIVQYSTIETFDYFLMLFEHQVHILTLHWKFKDLLGFLGNIDKDKQPSLI